MTSDGIIRPPEPPCLRRIRGEPGSEDPAFEYTYVGSRLRKTYIFGGYALGVPLALYDEYFEYLDLAEAIDAAGQVFTMVELGAGYGRWSVMAALGAQRTGRTPRLIAVEAELAHFEMMLEHFRDNGLNPGAHRLVKAAVNASGQEVFFPNGLSTQWWGQAILPSPDYRHGQGEGVSVERTPAVTLAGVLADVDFVDLVDMDIQGTEAEVVAATIDMLCAKVRRVHIGTHSHDIEAALRDSFNRACWTCRFDFECLGRRDTLYGPVDFEDGVQSWINDALVR